MADQGILRPHNIRQHLIQQVAATVAVAIAGGGSKAALADPMPDKSRQHFLLVVFCNVINAFKGCSGRSLSSVRKLRQPLIDWEKGSIHDCNSSVYRRCMIAQVPAGTKPSLA